MADGAARVRATVVLALAALLAACTPLDDFLASFPLFGRSMRSQPSFDPYENPRPAATGAVPFASPNYGVRGSVALGQPEGGEEPPPFTQGELESVAAALANPVGATEASLARGKVLFERFCAPCHGPDGRGATGYIIPAGFPPFPLISDRVRGFSDGYLYGIIRVGRNFMPAYGSMVSHWDRWHIVNYVRKLQRDAAAAAGAP